VAGAALEGRDGCAGAHRSIQQQPAFGGQWDSHHTDTDTDTDK
jgi:hypothetical protein